MPFQQQDDFERDMASSVMPRQSKAEVEAEVRKNRGVLDKALVNDKRVTAQWKGTRRITPRADDFESDMASAVVPSSGMSSFAWNPAAMPNKNTLKRVAPTAKPSQQGAGAGRELILDTGETLQPGARATLRPMTPAQPSPFVSPQAFADASASQHEVGFNEPMDKPMSFSDVAKMRQGNQARAVEAETERQKAAANKQRARAHGTGVLKSVLGAAAGVPTELVPDVASQTAADVGGGLTSAAGSTLSGMARPGMFNPTASLPLLREALEATAGRAGQYLQERGGEASDIAGAPEGVRRDVGRAVGALAPILAARNPGAIGAITYQQARGQGASEDEAIKQAAIATGSVMAMGGAAKLIGRAIPDAGAVGAATRFGLRAGANTAIPLAMDTPFRMQAGQGVLPPQRDVANAAVMGAGFAAMPHPVEAPETAGEPVTPEQRAAIDRRVTGSMLPPQETPTTFRYGRARADYEAQRAAEERATGEPVSVSPTEPSVEAAIEQGVNQRGPLASPRLNKRVMAIPAQPVSEPAPTRGLTAAETAEANRSRIPPGMVAAGPEDLGIPVGGGPLKPGERQGGQAVIPAGELTEQGIPAIDTRRMVRPEEMPDLARRGQQFASQSTEDLNVIPRERAAIVGQRNEQPAVPAGTRAGIESATNVVNAGRQPSGPNLTHPIASAPRTPSHGFVAGDTIRAARGGTNYRVESVNPNGVRVKALTARGELTKGRSQFFRNDDLRGFSGVGSAVTTIKPAVPRAAIRTEGLTNTIINLGGIRPDTPEGGDFNRYAGREGGRPGMMNASGHGVDEMLAHLDAEGYHFDSPSELLDAVRKEQNGHRVYSTAHDYDTHAEKIIAQHAASGTIESQARGDYRDLLNDPESAALLERLGVGEHTDEEVASFIDRARYVHNLDQKHISAIVEEAEANRAERRGVDAAGQGVKEGGIEAGQQGVGAEERAAGQREGDVNASDSTAGSSTSTPTVGNAVTSRIGNPSSVERALSGLRGAGTGEPASATTDQLSRVRSILDSLRTEATTTNRRLSDLVEDRINQQALPGMEQASLSADDATLLRDMARRVPAREPVKEQAQSLLDVAPTVESRQAGARAQEEARATGAANAPLFEGTVNPKQLHEMTRTEYVESAGTPDSQSLILDLMDSEKTLPEKGPERDAALDRERKRWAIKQENNHKRIVRQALNRGDTVPPEVLRDYPDLVEHHSQLQPRDAETGQFTLEEPPPESAKGPHGQFINSLFKSPDPDAGIPSFWANPEVRGKLGLKAEGKPAETKDALAQAVGKPRSSHLSPDDVRQWAQENGLSQDALTALDAAEAQYRAKQRAKELGGRDDDHDVITRYRNDIGKKSGDLSFGADPERAIKSAVVLGYDIYRGAKDFAAWSRKMAERLGERVRPYLRGVWDAVKELAADERGFVRIDTPEFKRWFGRSRVVDEKGEPLVVYHGTEQDFDSFSRLHVGKNTEAPSSKLGFFFVSDSETAADYGGIGGGRTVKDLKAVVDRLERTAQRSGRNADWTAYERAYEKYEDAAMKEDEPEGVNVIPAYLNLRNPLVYDFEGSQYREESYYDIISDAKKQGKDGAILKNTYDPGNESNRKLVDVYVAFDGKQIKSATGNSGAFNSESASLTDPPAVQSLIDRAKAAYERNVKPVAGGRESERGFLRVGGTPGKRPAIQPSLIEGEKPTGTPGRVTTGKHLVDVSVKRRVGRYLIDKNTYLDIANIPRTVKASLDVSAPLRQGAIFSITEPRASLHAGRDMFRALVKSKDGYRKLQGEIERHPSYKLAKDSGIEFTGDVEDFGGREEAFMSRFAGNIPGIRHSEQAYVTFLNSQRLYVFDKFSKQLQDNPKALQDIARFINAATGRGDVGSMSSSTKAVLNSLFFSPRYVASRVQVMNPKTYVSMEPAARKIALKKMFEYASAVGGVMGLAALGGARVVMNPEDSDFGKIVVGNTHYDASAGFAQYLRFAYRMGNAFRKGEVKEAVNIAGRFARSKLAPAPGSLVNLYKGTDFAGQPTTLKGEALDSIVPLIVKDAYDGWKDAGAVGVAKTVPASLVGVGVNTYQKEQKPERSAGEDAARKAATKAFNPDSSKPFAAEDKARRTAKQEIVDLVRNKKYAEAEAKAKALLDSGAVSGKELRLVGKRAMMSGDLQYDLSRASLEDALDIVNQKDLLTETERKQVRKTILDRVMKFDSSNYRGQDLPRVKQKAMKFAVDNIDMFTPAQQVAIRRAAQP